MFEKTRSGKTGAYLIPIFGQMDEELAIGSMVGRNEPFEGACDPPAGGKGGKHIEYSAIAAGGLHTWAPSHSSAFARMQAAGVAINGPCSLPVSVPIALRHRKGKGLCVPE